MVLCITVWNIVVFLIYGIDKLKAIRGSYRISENFLISSAVVMGAFGAMAGMYVFRHKTRKMKFRLIIPVAVVINLAVIYYLGIK